MCPFRGYPYPHHILQHLPTSLRPRSFSVSQPRDPCATVQNSVHTRKQRACSSHFPELNSKPLREGAQARISGPQPWSESGGLRAVGVRAPIGARARTRTPPVLSTNRLLPTPNNSTTYPSHRPRSRWRGSACSRPLARQPASRRVGKGSEPRSLRRAGGGGDGDLGGCGGGRGYDRDGCARSFGVMAAAGSR